MDYSAILLNLRNEIDADDRVREKILPFSRDAVRRCSESVKKTHKGMYEEAHRLVGEAYQIIQDAERTISESDFMSKARPLDTAYQELAKR